MVAGRLAKQYESYSGLTNLCENFAPLTACTEAALSIAIQMSPPFCQGWVLYAVQYSILSAVIGVGLPITIANVILSA